MNAEFGQDKHLKDTQHREQMQTSSYNKNEQESSSLDTHTVNCPVFWMDRQRMQR